MILNLDVDTCPYCGDTLLIQGRTLIATENEYLTKILDHTCATPKETPTP
jgi:hypothetical protein